MHWVHVWLPHAVCGAREQATKLRHQLAYEQRRDMGAEADAAKKEAAGLQAALDRAQEQARAAADASKAVEAELAEQARAPGLDMRGEEAIQLVSGQCCGWGHVSVLRAFTWVAVLAACCTLARCGSDIA